MAGSCLYCGRAIAGRADRQFCSPRCRTAAHRQEKGQDAQTPENRGDYSALHRGIGVRETASEGASTPADDVTATPHGSGLSDNIVRALMDAGLEVPNRSTVDVIGFTFAQRQAIDEHSRRRQREAR